MRELKRGEVRVKVRVEKGWKRELRRSEGQVNESDGEGWGMGKWESWWDRERARIRKIFLTYRENVTPINMLYRKLFVYYTEYNDGSVLTDKSLFMGKKS